MARPKSFDSNEVLDAAIATFREHGYEGSSAQMLVSAAGIGRQSLYDTFGDKWRLYLSALRRYAMSESQAHLASLKQGPRAIDGITAMIERVVADAAKACLGVNSICEFGQSRPDLIKIQEDAGRVIFRAIRERVTEAQAEGSVDANLDPDEVAEFMSASFAGIRVAVRGGASPAQADALGKMALRALR
jgi:AcrR family transcriptional regulator